MKKTYEIPIYRPSLTGNEKKYVNECLDSSWVSAKGRFVLEFESRFAEYIHVNHALTVCNGTTALHLALIALGIGEGDEVVVPTLTYIAPVNAITYTGAKPLFVDSDERTWQMNPRDIRRKISPRTKAIMVVHLYGHPCEMDELVSIAREHDLFIVEDCAEAFGSYYRNKHVGTFGDIATFSFYGNKAITTGEGGMVVTNNETLFNRAFSFRGQGLAKYREYWHDVIGYNFRMTNICAAIGLAQLEQADFFLTKKRQIADLYRNRFHNLPIFLHEETENVRHSYWMCSVLVEEARTRDPLRDFLEKGGVETRPVFYPVHTMPMYSERFQRHPVAENLGWRGISLPSWPGLEKQHVNKICDLVEQFVGNSR